MTRQREDQTTATVTLDLDTLRETTGHDTDPVLLNLANQGDQGHKTEKGVGRDPAIVKVEKTAKLKKENDPSLLIFKTTLDLLVG